jgi:putative ABC transport system ATP-binding protein
MLQIENLTKTYRLGNVEVPALRGVSFTINDGEVIAIMGRSGSGKSTLMSILGCLDLPTSGRYLLDGQDIFGLNDDRLAAIRNRKIGFVFQQFNLLSRTTTRRNVEMPMMYAGVGRGRRQRAESALEAVGLAHRMNHRPSELSGGEQQRVAIARALVNNPALILADEPTGNLDSHTGEEIVNLLLDLNKQRNLTLVLVTHDPDIAARALRTIRLIDGVIEQ